MADSFRIVAEASFPPVYFVDLRRGHMLINGPTRLGWVQPVDPDQDLVGQVLDLLADELPGGKVCVKVLS